jgi:hypothetical protein
MVHSELVDGNSRSPRKMCGYPHPPMKLYEYQRKRLTKFAFRKRLILKGAFLAILVLGLPEQLLAKKKSGSKLPYSKRSSLQR